MMEISPAAPEAVMGSDSDRTTGTLSWLQQLQAYLSIQSPDLPPSAAAQRQVLVSALTTSPQSADQWLRFLQNEETLLSLAPGVDDTLTIRGLRGPTGRSSVTLFHLYQQATELVPLIKGQTADAFLGLWLGYARLQWKLNIEEARDTFKTLKNQRVGDNSALLYHAWASLEAQSGSPSKALAVLQKGLKEGAKPASMLESLSNELRSGALNWTGGGGGTGPISIGVLDPAVIADHRSVSPLQPRTLSAAALPGKHVAWQDLKPSSSFISHTLDHAAGSKLAGLDVGTARLGHSGATATRFHDAAPHTGHSGYSRSTNSSGPSSLQLGSSQVTMASKTTGGLSSTSDEETTCCHSGTGSHLGHSRGRSFLGPDSTQHAHAMPAFHRDEDTTQRNAPGRVEGSSQAGHSCDANDAALTGGCGSSVGGGGNASGGGITLKRFAFNSKALRVTGVTSLRAASEAVAAADAAFEAAAAGATAAAMAPPATAPAAAAALAATAAAAADSTADAAATRLWAQQGRSPEAARQTVARTTPFGEACADAARESTAVALAVAAAAAAASSPSAMMQDAAAVCSDGEDRKRRADSGRDAGARPPAAAVDGSVPAKRRQSPEYQANREAARSPGGTFVGGTTASGTFAVPARPPPLCLPDAAAGSGPMQALYDSRISAPHPSGTMPGAAAAVPLQPRATISRQPSDENKAPVEALPPRCTAGIGAIAASSEHQPVQQQQQSDVRHVQQIQQLGGTPLASAVGVDQREPLRPMVAQQAAVGTPAALPPQQLSVPLAFSTPDTAAGGVGAVSSSSSAGGHHAPSTSMPAAGGPPPQQLAQAQTQPVEDAQWVFVRGNRYQKLDCVGKGGSSKVFKVLAINKQIYALKRVRMQHRDPEAVRGFVDEITLLNNLRGQPNIIQLVDAQVFLREGLIYMVLEHGDIDLARLLHNHGEALRRTGGTGAAGEIDENFIRLYWQQMLQAVRCIHDQRIVHSDLKPANFLLVQGTLKLIDFGIAKSIHGDTTNINRESPVGTLNYMAPEAIMGGSVNPLGGAPAKVGRPSDIWSLGCILYQMIYGATPFASYAFAAKMGAICNPQMSIQFPPCTNPAALDVMQRCLDRNPRTRIGMQELLDHPFLHPERRAVEPPPPCAAASPSLGALTQEQLKAIVSQVALSASAPGVTDIEAITRQVLQRLAAAASASTTSSAYHAENHHFSATADVPSGPSCSQGSALQSAGCSTTVAAAAQGHSRAADGVPPAPAAAAAARPPLPPAHVGQPSRLPAPPPSASMPPPPPPAAFKAAPPPPPPASMPPPPPPNLMPRPPPLGRPPPPPPNLMPPPLSAVAQACAGSSDGGGTALRACGPSAAAVVAPVAAPGGMAGLAAAAASVAAARRAAAAASMEPAAVPSRTAAVPPAGRPGLPLAGSELHAAITQKRSQLRPLDPNRGQHVAAPPGAGVVKGGVAGSSSDAGSGGGKGSSSSSIDAVLWRGLERFHFADQNSGPRP